MAEAVFRDLVFYQKAKQHPLIKTVDSCGTGAYHVGDPPHSRTMSVLKDHKISGYKHQARQVQASDFQDFDYILAMDDNNLADLRERAKKAADTSAAREDALSRVHLFGSFGGKSDHEEVDDPYYGGRQGFEIAYEQVRRFGEGLIKHIEDKAKL